VAPAVVVASLAVLDLLSGTAELRQRLFENANYFRARMTALGFTLLPGEHPIIPVMIGDAAMAGHLADRLLDKGVYVTAFSYPVVPQGTARIRTQMSAAHTREDLEQAALAFAEARAELGQQTGSPAGSRGQ
jgi:glycine C-acetyltransferase